MARDARVTVRVSAAELAEWRGKVRAAGLSLSELLRRAMARTRTWTAAASAVERERTRELARIGNNLNQLARWGNTYKQGTDPVAVVAQLPACERGSRLGQRREEVAFSLGDGFSDRSCRPLSPLEVAMPALQAAGCNALPCIRRPEYSGSYLSKKPGEAHWKASREGGRCMAAVNRGRV